MEQRLTQQVLRTFRNHLFFWEDTRVVSSIIVLCVCALPRLLPLVLLCLCVACHSVVLYFVSARKNAMAASRDGWHPSSFSTVDTSWRGDFGGVGPFLDMHTTSPARHGIARGHSAEMPPVESTRKLCLIGWHVLTSKCFLCSRICICF